MCRFTHYQIKIALLKDGEKQFANLEPYDNYRFWVEFESNPGKKCLYPIDQLRNMFKELYRGNKETV